MFELNSFINEIQSTDLLELTIFSNTLVEWGIAVLVFLASLLVLKIVQIIILSRLEKIAKKTKSDFDDTAIRIVKSLKPPFYYFLSFYIATQTLTFSPLISRGIDVVIIVWTIFQVLYACQIFIVYLSKKMLRTQDGEVNQSAVNAVQLLAQIGLWSVGLLLILSNLGVNVTSLIAGLGIGGIAIAFAVQGILSDLFSSFALYFDRPFEVGDFIVVGDTLGTVKKIGIKTTRIKSLQGEEIAIPNQKLTESTIQNYKRMERRRVAFDIRVTFQTSSKKLKAIPKDIERIISAQSDAEFSRAHFKTILTDSYGFEIVYFVTSSSYEMYMDVQQAINIGIVEYFKNANIELAYPAQSVVVRKSS